MSSIIVFLIIAYLIKKGMSQGVGFSGVSDIGRLFGIICTIVLIISLISSPVFWILLFLAIIAFVIFMINKNEADKRAKKYGWNTEEYRAKYAESLNKFKQAYKADQMDRGSYHRMNQTQRMTADLEIEKRARESAKAETDAYMRSKYGDPEAGYVHPQPEKSTASSAGGYAYSSSDSKQRKKEAALLKSKILPKAVSRRKKIISNFNDKYDLYLTEEQIKRIADASYMSVAWKNEVEAMSSKYDSVYEWMTGDTAYLRAYLRAFTVQDVTSDFKQQMQIVMDSFEEVFEFSDSMAALSIDQRIDKINSKFMTNFDEITYMIAYRYLEMLGLHHQLDKTQLNRADGSFDDLVSKYENMSTEDIDKDLEGMGTVSK